MNKYDSEFPKRYFQDFLDYTGIKEGEFYETLNKFRPSHLWVKSGINNSTHCADWKLKTSVR